MYNFLSTGYTSTPDGIVHSLHRPDSAFIRRRKAKVWCTALLLRQWDGVFNDFVIALSFIKGAWGTLARINITKTRERNWGTEVLH